MHSAVADIPDPAPAEQPPNNKAQPSRKPTTNPGSTNPGNAKPGSPNPSGAHTPANSRTAHPTPALFCQF